MFLVDLTLDNLFLKQKKKTLEFCFKFWRCYEQSESKVDWTGNYYWNCQIKDCKTALPVERILIYPGYIFVFSWSSTLVRFLDCLSSFVCPICLCKLFTFSSSSLEPLHQFQPNLAQSILGWIRFNFLKIKGHLNSFSRGDNNKSQNFVDKIKKKILQNPWANINQTWHKAWLGEGESLVQIKGHLLFQGEKIKNGEN